VKILHLTKKYPPALGGDAFSVFNLRKQQLDSGHEVHIGTPKCEEIENKEILKFGIRENLFNLDRIAPRRMMSLIILPFWGFKVIRKLRPDIIHSHSAELGFFISIVTRFFRIPVINTCHGISFDDEQYSFAKRFAEKFFLKYAGFEKIIAVDIKGLQSLKAAKIRNAAHVPNGVDLERFRHIKKRENFKTKFLFVGRLEKQKGVIHLLKAAEILKNKNDFEIIIVGEGSEAYSLMKTARELKIREVVIFKGKIDEQTLKEYYLGCDIFILPSLWEGLPLTLLEASAAEMSIIASNVGGISSMFIHEENALLVEPKNEEALAKAMLRLMQDKNLREKLGRNARKLVEKFSWENTAKALDEIYIEATRSNISRTL
jgi:glycosyltransferase involved in cell wall biosynthesis